MQRWHWGVQQHKKAIQMGAAGDDGARRGYINEHRTMNAWMQLWRRPRWGQEHSGSGGARQQLGCMGTAISVDVAGGPPRWWFALNTRHPVGLT